MLEKGTCVKVKEGIMDPDTHRYHLSGWQGRIAGTEKDENGETIVQIEWDSITLKNMPAAFIRESIGDGYEYGEMYLSEHDVIVVRCRDTIQDSLKARETIDRENEWVELGEQGQRISHVVASAKDDFQRMEAWQEHLESNMKLPLRVKYTGRSTQDLRHGDEVTLLAVLDYDDLRGLIGSGKVNRRSVSLLLCEVEVVEENEASLALQDYIVWFANR